MGRENSKPISINCDVHEGAPLSPNIFNIAEEICDPQYRTDGYLLDKNYDPLCLTGFADDSRVTAHSPTTAIRVRTIELVQVLYQKLVFN